jgi:hypothetical protein
MVVVMGEKRVRYQCITRRAPTNRKGNALTQNDNIVDCPTHIVAMHENNRTFPSAQV